MLPFVPCWTECSVHVFMADYSYFCGEHFAPRVKLVSQFMVTVLCLKNYRFNISNELEYRATCYTSLLIRSMLTVSSVVKEDVICWDIVNID